MISVRTAFRGRAIKVGMSPGVIGDDTAAQIGSSPTFDTCGPQRQCAQTFAARGISTKIQIEQIERGREALDLDLRFFALTFDSGKVIQNARADQSHDEPR